MTFQTSTEARGIIIDDAVAKDLADGGTVIGTVIEVQYTELSDIFGLQAVARAFALISGRVAESVILRVDGTERLVKVIIGRYAKVRTSALWVVIGMLQWEAPPYVVSVGDRLMACLAFDGDRWDWYMLRVLERDFENQDDPQN